MNLNIDKLLYLFLDMLSYILFLSQLIIFYFFLGQKSHIL